MQIFIDADVRGGERGAAWGRGMVFFTSWWREHVREKERVRDGRRERQRGTPVIDSALIYAYTARTAHMFLTFMCMFRESGAFSRAEFRAMA